MRARLHADLIWSAVSSPGNMRVGIIGGGAAGLASARHVSANGYECDVLEMSDELGGTWVYTDDVEKDRFGYPVYSAMYKDLRQVVTVIIFFFDSWQQQSTKDWENNHNVVQWDLIFLVDYAEQVTP